MITIDQAREKASARTGYGTNHHVSAGAVPTLARPDDVEQAMRGVDEARAVLDRMLGDLNAAKLKLAQAEQKDHDAIVAFVNDPHGPRPKDTVPAARRAVEVAEQYAQAAQARYEAAQDEVKALMLIHREDWHAEIVAETERLRAEAEEAGREFQEKLNGLYEAANEARSLARLRPNSPDGGFTNGAQAVTAPNVMAALAGRPEYPAIGLRGQAVPVDLASNDLLFPAVAGVASATVSPSDLVPGDDGVYRLRQGEPDPNAPGTMPGFDGKAAEREPHIDPHQGSVLSHGLDW